VVPFRCNRGNRTASGCDAEVAYFIDVAGPLALRYVATRCSPIFHGVQGVPSSNLGVPTIFLKLRMKSQIAAVVIVLVALAGRGACAPSAGSSASAPAKHSAGSSPDPADQVQEVTVTAHHLELE
jgi:hypothetical protein